MSRDSKLEKETLIRQLISDIEEATKLNGRISEFKPDKPMHVTQKSKKNGLSSRSRRNSGQFLPIIGSSSTKIHQQKDRILDRIENLNDLVSRLHAESNRMGKSSFVEEENVSRVSGESSRIESKVQ